MLLASDLDGTLISGDDEPVHRIAVRRLAEALAQRPHIRLAYVTGRSRALAERAIARYELPRPDFLACDVGTSVYVTSGDGFELDEAYVARMTAAMGGATADAVRRALATVPGLALQASQDQTDFKASFEFDMERHDETLHAVRGRLGDRSVSLVVSHDPYRGTGLLDVLPEGVAKHTAIDHLRSQASFGHDDVFYAGDSGNDLAAMLDGYRVVVVANAPSGLKDILRVEATRLGLLERLYFAEAPYASGVLEGCRHWGLIDGEA